MKIGVVTEHCCIRVLKECDVLNRLGYELYLISRNPVVNGMFKACIHYDGIQQLEYAIKLISDKVDIFHVHNEPTYPVTVVRETVPDATIILDMHDSSYWRLPDGFDYVSWVEEDVAYSCADAFVFPSESCMEYFYERDKLNGKPGIILPSACPERYFRYENKKYLIGLVSQGGHSVVSEPEKKGGEKDMSLDGWRDYGKLYKELTDKGVRVYVYSGAVTHNKDNELDKYYFDAGAILGKFDYNTLITRVSYHTWNLVGNTTDHSVWKYALPNKLFDAIIAGTPSVVFNCPEAAKLVSEHNIGIVVKDVDEFIKRWDEHKECRKNLMLHRKKYSMENYISGLESLYKSLV